MYTYICIRSFFALTTFVLNYVPEVGPFVAMVGARSCLKSSRFIKGGCSGNRVH